MNNNNPYSNLQYRPAHSRVDELFLNPPLSNYPFFFKDISQRILDDIKGGYCPFLEWLFMYPDRANTLPSPYRDGLTDACSKLYGAKVNNPLREIISYLHSVLVRNLQDARETNYPFLPMQYLTHEYYTNSAGTEQNNESLRNQVQNLRNQLQDKETELATVRAKLDSANEWGTNAQNNLRQAREDRKAAEQEKNDTVARYKLLTETFEKDKPRLIRDALEMRWDEYRAEREAGLEQKLQAEESRRMEEIQRQAEEESRRLVDEKLKNYLEEEHSEWNRFREEVNRSYDEQSASLSLAKKEACDESARMQREMKKFMDDYMVNFCANLDAWRNSVYDVEVKEFAQWYTSFYAFVDKLDYRIANELSREAADALQKIARYLKNLRKRLESVVLPKMGLRPFSPQRGDPFDSVLHVQKQYDDDYEEDFSGDIVPEKLVVRCCVTPGVEKIMADRGMLNILVKAEVETAAPDVLAAEDAKRTAESAAPETADAPAAAERQDNPIPVPTVTSSEEVHNNEGEIVDRTGL